MTVKYTKSIESLTLSFHFTKDYKRELQCCFGQCTSAKNNENLAYSPKIIIPTQEKKENTSSMQI